MVRGDIVKIEKIRCSLSCLTGAKPLVVSVSCSTPRPPSAPHLKKKKKKRLVLQRHGASSNICTWQPPATKGNGGPESVDGSSTNPPSQLSTSSPTPPPLSQHIRRTRLTFTQLSTLQRQEIYSASGPGWSQASTWASPHDDPVAQPWNEAGLRKRVAWGRGKKTEREGWMSRFSWTFLWQILIDVQGEDNKRCASRSTLKRLAKLITQFHLSHSEDSLPWILPQR